MLICLFNKIKFIRNQYTFVAVPNNTCNLSIYAYCKNSINIRYRTINGSCNNLVKPWIGSALTPMKRFNGGSSAYSDAMGSPRCKSILSKYK